MEQLTVSKNLCICVKVMILTKQLRIIILAVTLSSVLLVLVKVLLATNVEKPKSATPRGEFHTISLFEKYVSMLSHPTEYHV